MGMEVGRPPGFCGIRVTTAGGGGVIVSSVLAGTAAARGGFLSGDRLLEVAGVPVKTPDESVDRISSYLSGDTVEFTIQRAGARRTLKITLGTRPEFKK